jgi:hypothetical protein
MLSILEYSKPVVEFLNRSDDDSLSNDYNNVKILATVAITLSLLYVRYVGVGELVTGELKELVPLSRVAVAGGGEEAVSIPELKMAVAKALRILIAKLDTKSQPNEDIIVQDSTSPINNQQNKQ